MFPARMTFVDVETTGLSDSDRVVSLGIIDLEGEPLARGKFHFDLIHLIFDPRKKSHPRAEAVHGYDDWILRHQQLFEDHVDVLHPYFTHSGLIAAHNAPFDERFIRREFELCGMPVRKEPFTCTMQDFKLKRFGRAGLDYACEALGLSRRQGVHGAFDDAWRAMCVYLGLRGVSVPVIDHPLFSAPSNFQAAPPHPGLPLPRRSRRKNLLKNALLDATRDAEESDGPRNNSQVSNSTDLSFHRSKIVGIVIERSEQLKAAQPNIVANAGSVLRNTTHADPLNSIKQEKLSDTLLDDLRQLTYLIKNVSDALGKLQALTVQIAEKQSEENLKLELINSEIKMLSDSISNLKSDLQQVKEDTYSSRFRTINIQSLISELPTSISQFKINFFFVIIVSFSILFQEEIKQFVGLNTASNYANQISTIHR